MKNFWITDTGFGRDLFLFKAKDNDELEKFLIIQHNIDVEREIKYSGSSIFHKIKTFPECKYLIQSEATDKDTKEKNTFAFNVISQLEIIRRKYKLGNFSIEELIEQSFHGLESLIKNENIIKENQLI